MLQGLCRGGGNRRLASLNHGLHRFLGCLDAKKHRGKVCYDNKNILSLGRESKRSSETSYACERGLSNEFNNRLDCHAIACNDVKNFTDKVYSLFTTHHSLKRPGATHVALCDSVGSYFRHWCGAFTLAEVLITLGIIGVVAAMTMPSLMQNYKRQQATARIKKFVSVINQALISAENDLGPREDWVKGEEDNSDSAYNFLNTYIKPYIKSADIEKRTLLGMNMATLRFVDGSQMSIKIGACYDIYYDINGEKGPNEKGKDIFVFILCKNGGCNSNSNQVRGMYCQPNGEPFPTHEQLISNCKSGGSWCTILLEQNGYEFPKDYPLGL